MVLWSRRGLAKAPLPIPSHPKIMKQGPVAKHGPKPCQAMAKPWPSICGAQPSPAKPVQAIWALPKLFPTGFIRTLDGSVLGYVLGLGPPIRDLSQKERIAVLPTAPKRHPGVSQLNNPARGRVRCRRLLHLRRSLCPRFKLFFCVFDVFDSMAQHGANGASKMGQHGPQDGPTWAKVGPKNAMSRWWQHGTGFVCFFSMRF